MTDRRSVGFTGISVLGVALAGCAVETATFRPADASGGRRGQSAATHFDIEVGGEDLGAVKVWSDGAHPDPDHPTQLVVTVRLRIQNQSGAAMTLDLTHSDLEIVTEDRTLELVDAPTSSTGDVTVAPGQMGRIGLRYPVPSGLRVRDLSGFDFNFTIDTGQGAFLETASFGRQRSDRQGVYFWPVWEPWWWGYPHYPWGVWPGVGIGVGVGVDVHHRPRGGRGGRPPPHRR